MADKSIYKYSSGCVHPATILYHLSSGAKTMIELRGLMKLERFDLNLGQKLNNMKAKKGLITNTSNTRHDNKWKITAEGRGYLALHEDKVQLDGIDFTQTVPMVRKPKAEPQPELNFSPAANAVMDAIAPILDEDEKLGALMTDLTIKLNHPLLQESREVPPIETGLMESISKTQKQNAERINSLIKLRSQIQTWLYFSAPTQSVHHHQEWNESVKDRRQSPCLEKKH